MGQGTISIIFAIYATIIAALAVGVFAFISGIILLFQSVATGIFFMGAGIVATAATIFFAPLVWRVTKWLFEFARKLKLEYFIQVDDAPEATNMPAGKRTKNRATLIWLIILGLFASPILIPVALGLIAALFGVFIAFGRFSWRS
ncbi:hypothetical protein H7R52_17255 [Weissella confusa]|uniref:Uncharacterized protein n=1 Tax=Weissella confusa TaxID=1583 RepID=A0A923NHQ4_WEICO|nr:hypothetical protein [Weissella confusa]